MTVSRIFPPLGEAGPFLSVDWKEQLYQWTVLVMSIYGNGTFHLRGCWRGFRKADETMDCSMFLFIEMEHSICEIG